MYEIWETITDVLLPVFLTVVCLFLGVAVFLVPLSWFSSKNEAQLYNQKFNTHYTTSQFFWAGSTIKEFLNEGKQSTQNINIKGSIPVEIVK